MKPSEWNDRFEQQARWTSDLRSYLYGRIEIEKAGRILDVGCGTGALLGELLHRTPGKVCGVDLNPTYLSYTKSNLTPQPSHTEKSPAGKGTTSIRLALVQADALHLPLAPGSFDVALCHFLLLWVTDPVRVIDEMRRVTRPGGAVLALAEPDYGGRIDHPPALVPLGRLQREALQRQGADPDIGRKLKELFFRVGLEEVETGVIGGQWRGAPVSEELESEWAVLRDDLFGLVPKARLDELEALEAQAWKRGERILFVPTFYAVGFVARERGYN